MKTMGKFLACLLLLTAVLASFPAAAGAASQVAFSPSPLVGVSQGSTIAIAVGQTKDIAFTSGAMVGNIYQNWQFTPYMEGYVATTVRAAEGKVQITGLKPGTVQVNLVWPGVGYLSFNVTVTGVGAVATAYGPGYPYLYGWNGYYPYDPYYGYDDGYYDEYGYNGWLNSVYYRHGVPVYYPTYNPADYYNTWYDATWHDYWNAYYRPRTFETGGLTAWNK